jgi:hypothetical protein
VRSLILETKDAGFAFDYQSGRVASQFEIGCRRMRSIRRSFGSAAYGFDCHCRTTAGRPIRSRRHSRRHGLLRETLPPAPVPFGPIMAFNLTSP